MCLQQSQWLICDDLYYLLTLGSKLYGQIRGIPMGTNCASLVADLFQFPYERDFLTIVKMVLLKLLTHWYQTTLLFNRLVRLAQE